MILIIVGLLFFPTIKPVKTVEKVVYLNLVVEDIPITRQGAFRPPPPKPAVPIPSEEEAIPEDVTIEKTELNFNALPSAGSDKGYGVPSFVPPRPIAEVIPEYPKEDYKNGVTGYVELHVLIDQSGKVTEVIVLENTTNSKRCAEAAKEAAFRCRYIPARQSKQTISCWITRLIKFDIPK